MMSILLKSRRYSFAAFLLAVAVLKIVSPVNAAETTTAPSGNYRLQAGDVMRIQIFQEPDLDRELAVSQQGEVFLPLIGQVQVKDRTLSEVRENVRERYDRDYLVNPQVNVTVVKYRERKVSVVGRVAAPKWVEIPPEQSLSIVDAITQAGGLDRLADPTRVKLNRTYPDGRSQSFTINVKDLLSGKDTKQWNLLADDVVYVPERIL